MSEVKAPETQATGSVPAVEVYAVYGVEPEVQAYAMAKYSRSALSMKESLRELNQQKAEKFLKRCHPELVVSKQKLRQAEAIQRTFP